MHLTTEHLHLTRFTATDAPHLFRLDSDPEVMRFINGGIATPMAVVEQQILPLFRQQHEQGSPFGFWAARLQATDEFIGWFSLRPAGTDSQAAELGYRLSRRFWGAGYATEGARKLVDLGFTRYKLQRITASTYEANLASIRVMQKLGMTHCRSFRWKQSDLKRADTYHNNSVDLWEGEDLEYELTAMQWYGLQV